MKTIQIPTTSNPFIVNINNHGYQYRAGETTEVPDEVAEAIEDAVELAPKPKIYLSKLAQLIGGILTEITAEDLSGISMLSTCAFYNKKSLQKVTIPDNITTISTSVFAFCDNLASVYLPEMPPILVKATSFENIKADCVFYCKTQASKEAYASAPIWSEMTGTYSFVVEE